MTAADRGFSLSKTVYAQGTSDLLVSISIGASTLRVPGLDFAAMPLWWQEFQPTWLSTTPAVLRILAEDRGDLRDVLRRFPPRYIVSGAGPLPVDEARGFEAALGIQILDGYGLSEAPIIAGGALREAGRPPGTTGRPRCDIRIVCETGKPLAAGTTGEIAVRGPRVFPGYLDDPDANAAAFLPGGWFRTGDLGFLDADGYLHLAGRRGEIVNRGGEKIAPHEVDVALARHAAVADAAVFAVPDARLGEDIVAAVVLKRGAACGARELRRWMLDRLSPHKVPRRIWFVDDLPRTATGKVQRHALARRWSEEHA